MTALRFQNQDLSFEELDRWAEALSADLVDRPIGTRIGLLAPPSFEYFAGLKAVWKAGLIAVPLQPTHPLEELMNLIQDSDPALILVHPTLENLAQTLRQNGSRFEILAIRASADRRGATRSPSGHDGALMIYTSGTTGRPKGVITTYSALRSQVSSLIEAWQWTSADRTLNVLPLHHVHGVVVLSACALESRATMEIAERFLPDMVWDRIATGAINVFMGVPTIYARLIEHFDKQNPETKKAWGEAAGRMRLTVSGSAALPETLFNKWKALSGQPLLERYGMTEFGIALSNPYDGPRKAGYVGFPLPGVEVRLKGDELQVRGTTVFQSYWRQPEVSRQSFTEDGWFKTGDTAKQDADGAYRILGRSSQDIIKTGGYKVSALEIENRLLEHPSVHEAAVVGAPDETWGERVVAFIVPSPEDKSLNVEDLDLFLRDKLARYKIPTLWRIAESLPRNAMGKVLKRNLLKLAP